MEHLSEIKQYAKERSDIRINSFGYTNTRIKKLKLKQLKGYIKQYENEHILIRYNDDFHKIKKEMEFRQICLSLKSLFSIEVK
jgi:hypothetical protein